MASVLATLAALAVIGLLFALDPGGAIAESGFPDYREMDWKQLTAWGFRTIGVGVGLLLLLLVWLKYRSWQEIKYPGLMEPVTRQPSELPAAAVSVLEDREATDRTLLAAIVEMCQRGTLQFECVGTESGYRYRLSKQGPAQFDWEQLICNRLPPRPTTVQELHDGISEREDGIGSQLGQYLQARGLFDDNPIRVMRDHGGDGVDLGALAGALMGVGGGLWLALWLPQWWANSLVGALIGCIYWLIGTPMNTGLLPPTEAGAYEIGQWLGLKESLPGPDREAGRDEPDSMLAYAIALDKAQPWLDVSVPAPPWSGSGEAASLSASDQDVAYHGFMSSPAWAWPEGPQARRKRLRGLFPRQSRNCPRNCPDWRRRTLSRLKGRRRARAVSERRMRDHKLRTPPLSRRREGRQRQTPRGRRSTIGSTGLRGRWRRRRADGGAVGA